jgi:DNA-binding response OmpR family regulator/HPt (histidine-containing phosphotransfer) domain-containing protein
MHLNETDVALLDFDHLNRLAAKPAGCRELVEAFLDTTEPILDELERANRRQNETEFRQLLHALIGAATSAGARALAEGCEALAQRREPEQRAATLRDLAACFRQTRVVLMTFANALPAETGRSARDGAARKTLLLVEDNATARGLLHAMLADEYELFDAETGETALRFCEGEVLPDAAIVDLNLGRSNCSGLDVLQQFDGRIPAIVLTVDRSRDSMRAAVRAGAWAYLIKPPDPDLLVAAVEAAIARAGGIADRSAPDAFDLATGVVMAAHALDPPEAQRLIATQAMAQRRKPVDLAEEIVAVQQFHNRMTRAARSLPGLADALPS